MLIDASFALIGVRLVRISYKGLKRAQISCYTYQLVGVVLGLSLMREEPGWQQTAEEPGYEQAEQ